MAAEYMRLRKILILVVLVVLIPVAKAQQTPQYSQYVMNGFLLNPSYAGSDGYTSFSLTAREQWVGLDDSPSTFAVAAQTRLLNDSYISKATSVRKKINRPTKGGHVGVGGYVFADRNGIMKRTGAQLAYAYHINMTNYRQLSFGLSLTAYQYFVDKSGAVLGDDLYYDKPDVWFDNYDGTVFITDANFGVSYMTRKYYVGYSMNNLLRGLIMFGNKGDNTHSELGHYYLTGGYKIELPADDWMIEPSAMIKSSDMMFKSIQMDVTARVYYKEEYWMGLSYRTSDAIVLLAGLKYDRYYFGYACDFTLSDLRTQSFGTHELTIVAKFGDSARRYRWINRY
jgi:type IX secretion system PorP/SprF family membrane protein